VAVKKVSEYITEVRRFSSPAILYNQPERTLMAAMTVLMTTNFGKIKIELNPEKAPKTVANFLAYVKEGFYTNTLFHRVIKDFMIQGGGFERGLKQKTTKATIENEANNGLRNLKYAIAMARTSDPHSASAQFFINTNKHNDFLDFPGQDGWGYCVFGTVVEGMETVDKINATPTGRSSMFNDVPTEEVVILKAEIIE
jgi:peptidyl-prolyl cis-trans isomerase B (cyclophilin B)